MILASMLALALLLGTGEPPPLCGDWQALNEEAIEKGYFGRPLDEVTNLYTKAAEAAQCLQEPPEVIDDLWLHYAGWLSVDNPADAVAFAEKRLKEIREKQGDRQPREIRYLWFESYTLRNNGLDIPRAEEAVLRALRISREARGEESPDVAAALRRVAFFYAGTGKREKGIETIDQAIHIAEKAGRGGKVELYEALAAKDTFLSNLPTKDLDQIMRLRDRWNALLREIEAEGLPTDQTVW